MATSLGWRDVGTVLLSKADAERRKGDERRGEDGRAPPVFEGAVMSRRQHRLRPVDKGPEKEEGPALVTDLHTVLEKKPESRLKWLHKALMGAGKKQIKVGVLYDIVTHKKFVADVRSGTGAQMKALLLANLHLFSSKQQKCFESDSSPFGDFPDAPSSSRGEARQSSGTARREAERRDAELREAERRDAEEREAERRDAERREAERREAAEQDSSSKRRRMSATTDISSRTSRERHGRQRDSSEEPMSRHKEAASTSKPLAEGRVDPRIYSRGAADEPSDGSEA